MKISALLKTENWNKELKRKKKEIRRRKNMFGLGFKKYILLHTCQQHNINDVFMVFEILTTVLRWFDVR